MHPKVKIMLAFLALVGLIYLIYFLRRKEDVIECPECGSEVNLYADRCSNCGHEKGPHNIEEGEENENG